MDLRLDQCSHCACTTVLVGYTRERAILELNDGTLACWNCLDQQAGGDFHVSCVVLYDGDERVLDNRCVERKVSSHKVWGHRGGQPDERDTAGPSADDSEGTRGMVAEIEKPGQPEEATMEDR